MILSEAELDFGLDCQSPLVNGSTITKVSAAIKLNNPKERSKCDHISFPPEISKRDVVSLLTIILSQ
ncbi:hypothetical protein AM10699_59480 (plasmid) [Acaryochloris marina MBIC10699]|nr:hypothetical protein AM10699_59480 [Acaryochloris marina MBIC10699]